MSLTWKEIAAKKRDALLNSIPSNWIIPDSARPPEYQLDVTEFPNQSGWFDDHELDITSRDAADILTRLRNGEWTSEEVTNAFCKRAAAAHQLTNCLSETLFETALDDARRLDEYLQETREPKGPLHGLPISIKDNFYVNGKDSTLGFVSLANKPATLNSPLVDMLKDLGAVIYCKTNVPTAMMIAETVNNLFGRTVNPLNRNLTSGGSSGGESALIAFGGSPLGVGSDIGGSLRIPAACTGLYTIRPSFGRFPTIWTRSGLGGQEAVQSVNGPMSKSLRDLEVYCRAVVGGSPWLKDPRCLPLPWRQISLKSKLKIGVIWNDGIVRPTPPVSRALRDTADKLRAAGHEVIDWEPVGHPEGLNLLQRMFTADGGKSIKKLLDPVGEPLLPGLDYYRTAQDIRVYDMWQIQAARTELCKAYLDRWNACEGLDAILCPTTPYASVSHGDFKYVGYTGIFNLLDYSALSFPTGIRADAKLDVKDPKEKPLSELCGSILKSYDENVVHGHPVSLQLVARRLEEEKLLLMAETIASLL